MSQPHQHKGGFLEHEIEKLEPIPVRITHNDVQNVREEPADFGSWETTIFLGTAADQPVQILQQTMKRRRAVIIIGGTFPNVTGVPTIGYAILGSQNQVNNAGVLGAVGGIVYPGMNIVVESGSALWAISDKAHATIITVLDERYQ